jgi:hypothetical protein
MLSIKNILPSRVINRYMKWLTQLKKQKKAYNGLVTRRSRAVVARWVCNPQGVQGQTIINKKFLLVMRVLCLMSEKGETGGGNLDI